MNILVIGPPGAGKGTQAAEIVHRYGLCHLSTGDILRAEIKMGTELGKTAHDHMEDGGLVPDNIINKMVKAAILRKQVNKAGILLDGYPRTLSQAINLDEMLKGHDIDIHKVLFIKVPHDMLADRLVHRLTCPECKRIFSSKACPPTRGNTCDTCGKQLRVREDDTAEVVEQRLTVYERETEPVIEHYRELGLLEDVDGTKSIDDISLSIAEILDRVKAEVH
jgi:adenylate kinase